MAKMKVPDDYVPVHVRIQKFRQDHPEGVIVTSRTDVDDSTVSFKAAVYRSVKEATELGEFGLAASTGHAEVEVSDQKDVEKCETISIGRALATLGYELKSGIASAEELEGLDEENSSERSSRRSKRRRRSSEKDEAEKEESPEEESEEAVEEDDSKEDKKESRRERLRNRRGRREQAETSQEKEEEESEEQEDDSERKSRRRSRRGRLS